MTQSLLGVDAGGSHTRVGILHLPTGEWRVGVAAGANWTVHGPTVCRERLAAAILDAGGPPGSPCAARLGFAGFYPPHHQPTAGALLAELIVGMDPVGIGSDLETACAGALAGQAGLVVIAGTGSVACGVAEDGRFERAGGWGPLVGDPGSGHELGLLTLQLAAQWVDAGRRVPRYLVEILGEVPTRQRVAEWIRSAYREAWSREEIALLAPILLRAASDGDRAAMRAVTNSAGRLACQVAAVSRRLRLGSGFPITYQGGLLTGSEYFREKFFQRLRDRGVTGVASPPLMDPLAGAVLLAARSVSRSTEDAARAFLLGHPIQASP